MILPDFLPSRVLANFPEEFQSEIEHHRKLGAYTDAHSAFGRRVRRLSGTLLRYGATVMDVFYEHFLSRSWHLHSGTPLVTLISEVYATFAHSRKNLQDEIFEHLRHLKKANWMSSYAEIKSVNAALARISQRFRRYLDLTPSVVVLEKDYHELGFPFAELFADLLKCLRFAPLH